MLTAFFQLENKLRSLSTVLRQTLQQALHPVTFAIASSPVREASILDAAILVDQNSSETWPKSNQLASPSRNRTFAVVDRTADIKLAARELVAARFAFGGSSPYAPDLVLVNEFVKQEFSQAVVDESRKLSSGTQAIGDVKSKSDGSSKNDEKIGALKKADRHLQIALQESNAVVVDLHTRRSELLETKTEAPTLAVHAIKSLDDAIDFIGSAESGPALAAYHFGNAQVSKYLAQFVDARASFVNHVPRELLVGPAHPASHVIDVAARYTVDMFSLARPAFTKSSPTSSELAAALSSANSTAARKLLEQALQPLKITKRMPGGGISAVGMLSSPSSDFQCVRASCANISCRRFLRARHLDRFEYDTHCHRQCDGGGRYLVCEEWEDPVVGVKGLAGRLWGGARSVGRCGFDDECKCGPSGKDRSHRRLRVQTMQKTVSSDFISSCLLTASPSMMPYTYEIPSSWNSPCFGKGLITTGNLHP